MAVFHWEHYTWVMTIPKEQRAVMALLVHAALADGGKSDAERAALRQMSQALAVGGAELWSVYQEILAGQLPVETAARAIETRETRVLGYEMAVGVCETDGPANESEKAFLARLRTALRLESEPAAIQAEKLGTEVASAVPALKSEPAGAGQAPTPTLAPVDSAALEKRVLNYSILTGALELLPQSLATMAVVPLQMKLVYGIGKDHGYTLDRGHIREFMGTVGVGLAAQAVEGYARKLLGGLVGGLLGGGLLGGLARGAVSTGTGAAFTFSATYGLGQLAIRYYGGGRKMEMAVLKDTYGTLLEKGRSLFVQHQGAVTQRAATLTPSEVINLVRQ